MLFHDENESFRVFSNSPSALGLPDNSKNSRIKNKIGKFLF
jgi:hypothetical protein